MRSVPTYFGSCWAPWRTCCHSEVRFPTWRSRAFIWAKSQLCSIRNGFRQQTADRFVMISKNRPTYWLLHLIGKLLTCRSRIWGWIHMSTNSWQICFDFWGYFNILHLTCRIYVSWCQKLTPYTWKPCLRHQVYYSKSFISKINKQLTFAKIV